MIGHCGFSANIPAARRSSAEAQAPAAVGGRLGQHVPLQRRGRQAGALHGGRVHGHGGAGELRAQVQGESRATFVGNVFFFFFSLADPQIPTITLIFFKIDFAGKGRLLTWTVVLYYIVLLLCHPKPSVKQ